jgi:hypothetical protein
MVPIIERLGFNELKAQLNVEKSPRSPGSLRYSWNNLRQDGHRIIARLDRCYVFQSTGIAARKIIAYRIKGDTGRSDHQPVNLSIESEPGQSKPNHWHMSTYHLEEALPSLKNLYLSPLRFTVFHEN